MEYKKILLTSIIFLILSSVINSQVVNIEKKRKDNAEGFLGAIGLGFHLLDNGSKVIQFTNDIDIQYRTGAHTILLINDLSLMSVDDENIINSGFQHLRYNYTIRDSSFFTFEALAQHQYNPIKLLARRFVLGAGPRFRIVDMKKVSLYMASPVFYEHESLSDSLSSSSKIWRLDAYITFKWQINENLKFGSITYYQPDFRDFRDYRISSESALTFKITDKLEFNTGYEASYDSDPPENIQKLFYYWRNKLSYSF